MPELVEGNVIRDLVHFHGIPARRQGRRKTDPYFRREDGGDGSGVPSFLCKQESYSLFSKNENNAFFVLKFVVIKYI